MSNYSAVCEKGPVREKNEDSYEAKILHGCLCMIVADGLGGEVSGEIASKIGLFKGPSWKATRSRVSR